MEVKWHTASDTYERVQ